MKEKLKIGVFLNSNLLPAWEYKVLEEIQNSDYAQITLIIKNNTKKLVPKRGDSNLGSVVFRFHLILDSLVFTHKNIYSKKRDITKLVKFIPELTIAQGEYGIQTELTELDITAIEKYNLDILLKFGFIDLKGDILRIPKYGIWSYLISNKNFHNEVTYGYFEVVLKSPVTSIELVTLNEDSNDGTIINRTWESSCPYSINLNRNKVFWRASLLAPRIMNGVYRYGISYLSRLIDKRKKEYRSSQTDFYSAPSLLPSIRNLLAYFLILGQQILKKLYYTDAYDWILLFKITGNKDILHNYFSDFKILKSSTDRFWADPFVYFKNGKYFVFVEEFIYNTNKGHISVLELDDNGTLLSVERVIEKPYHMSYPFIFELDNTCYMIPESSQNRSIDLYECVCFPNKWEFVKNIMCNLSAVDTTLFYHNYKWWLFTSIDKTDSISGFDTDLFLFFSDDIFSDNWESHPNNPIVSDARIARPAGAIFIHEDKIFRPSQDCSGRYGKAFNFNQITVLTETDYEEILVSRVDPEWDKKLKGTHTFNFNNNFTVIDAYSFRKRFNYS